MELLFGARHGAQEIHKGKKKTSLNHSNKLSNANLMVTEFL